VQAERLDVLDSAVERREPSSRPTSDESEPKSHPKQLPVLAS
jgi:hypothetical protein